MTKPISELTDEELFAERAKWNQKITDATSWGGSLAAASEFRDECDAEIRRRGAALAEASKLPRFIFLNGPAGSGKDAVATFLCEIDPGFQMLKLSTPLYDVLSALERTEISPFDAEAKRGPSSIFPAVTRRQLLIDIGYFLHSYDPEVLGRLLFEDSAHSAYELIDTFLVTDVRLVQNLIAIIRGAGAERCLLIRIHRPEHSWAGDVGAYITNDEVPCRCLDLYNDSTLDDLGLRVLSLLEIDGPDLLPSDGHHRDASPPEYVP